MGHNNITWFFFASLALENSSKNTFRLNTCGSGLVGYEDGPGGIGDGDGENIGCRS